MSQERDKFVIRLPDDMHPRIKNIARLNNRSMNNEIVARIERTFTLDETMELEAKIKGLMLQRIESLESELAQMRETAEEKITHGPARYSR